MDWVYLTLELEFLPLIRFALINRKNNGAKLQNLPNLTILNIGTNQYQRTDLIKSLSTLFWFKLKYWLCYLQWHLTRNKRGKYWANNRYNSLCEWIFFRAPLKRKWHLPRQCIPNVLRCQRLNEYDKCMVTRGSWTDDSLVIRDSVSE